jgi:hypothetical protein
LKDFAKQLPEDVHVLMIMDGAGWCTKKKWREHSGYGITL